MPEKVGNVLEVSIALSSPSVPTISLYSPSVSKHVDSPCLLPTSSNRWHLLLSICFILYLVSILSKSNELESWSWTFGLGQLNCSYYRVVQTQARIWLVSDYDNECFLWLESVEPPTTVALEHAKREQTFFLNNGSTEVKCQEIIKYLEPSLCQCFTIDRSGKAMLWTSWFIHELYSIANADLTSARSSHLK